MIKAVIFDFDGVLAESVDIKTNAFAKLFESEGDTIVKEVLDYHLNNTGVSRFEKFKYIYKNILRRDLSETEFEDLCQRFSKLVKDKVSAAPYVKGALEFLESFSSRYECFISSATPQDEIEAIVQYRDIGKYFRGIYGSPKTKEDIVKDIKLKNNFAPHDVVYVGDALNDYKASIANSIYFIARINDNKKIFSGIQCPQIRDLTNLNEIIVSHIKNFSGIGKNVILVHGSFSPDRIAKKFSKTPWLFFDQGYLDRMKWEKALGVDLKFNYKEELKKVSHELRDEFVEWSARLGEPHWNKWYWWVTRLATRNNMTSNFYPRFKFLIILLPLHLLLYPLVLIPLWL